MATPGVGSDIEDTCNRCGDTWHVVMAKVGDKVIKVVCKLCGAQHNYRNDKVAAAAGGKTAGPNGRRVWKKKVTKAAPPALVVPPFDPAQPPRRYAGTESYRTGERVDHPVFGVGVVATLPGNGKAEIAFPSGPRVLACAKIESTLARPNQVVVPIADRPPGADGKPGGS